MYKELKPAARLVSSPWACQVLHLLCAPPSRPHYLYFRSSLCVSHVLLVVKAVIACFQAAAVQIASCGSKAQDNSADECWAGLATLCCVVK